MWIFHEASKRDADSSELSRTAYEVMLILTPWVILLLVLR